MLTGEGILRRLLPVRESETESVAFCFLINFFLGVSFLIGSSLSQSLFLKEVGAEHLPFAMTLTAAAVILTFPFYDWLVARVDVSRVFHVFTLLIATGLVAAARLLATASPPRGLFLFLVIWNAVSGMLYFTHFSNYLTHFFDILQTKRLLPFIYSGVILGAIAGGFTLPSILLVTGIPLLLLGWAILLVLVSGLAEANRKNRTLQRTFEKAGGFLESLRENFRVVGKTPFIRVTLLAYLFGDLALAGSSIISQTIFATDPRFADAEQLGAFFARLDGWIAVLGLALEVVLIPILLRHGGVRTINFLLPAATLLSLALLLVFPPFAFLLAVFMRFNISAGSEYIEPSASGLLFNALPPADKSRVLGFYNGFVEPLGPIGTGLLLSFLMNYFPLQKLVLIFAGFALLYLFMTILQNRLYVATLLGFLASSRLDLFARASEGMRDPDSRVLLALENYLQQGELRTASLSARLLAEIRGPGSAPALKNALERNDPEFQAEILRLLSELPREQDVSLPEVGLFLSSESESLRREALLLIDRRGLIAKHRVQLRELMKSPGPVTASFAALAAAQDPELRKGAEIYLKNALAGNDPETARAVFSAMSEMKRVPDFLHESLILLLRRSDFLAREAARSLNAAFDGISTGAGNLLDAATIEAGARNPITEVRFLLLRFLSRKKDSNSLKGILPLLLSDVSDATRALAIRTADEIFTPDEVRERKSRARSRREWCSWLSIEAVRAAKTAPHDSPLSPVNAALAEAAACLLDRAQLREKTALAGPYALVDAVFRDETKVCLETALKLLCNLPRRPDAAAVGRGLSSGDPRRRANALEALLNIGGREAKTAAALFEILLSSLTPSGISPMIHKALPEAKAAPEKRLERLARSDDPWESAIARAALAGA